MKPPCPRSLRRYRPHSYHDPAPQHMIGPVSSPAPDLTKLRIVRDVPPPVRRAFLRNLVILLVAVALVAAVVVVMRQRAVVPVQVITVQATRGSPGAASSGGASVTANGYVVARTRAAVS